MKIALLCSAINKIPPAKSGGTEQPIYYLARELAQRGHDVFLYAGPGSKVPGVNAREVCSVDIRKKEQNIYSQERIANYFDLVFLADFFYKEAKNYDLVQFNSSRFYNVLPFASLAKTPLIVRINYPHDYVYSIAEESLRKISSVHYLPISHFIKTLMPNLPYLAPIHPGLDLDDFPLSKKVGDYLLFVGRICHNKGVHLAIEVAKKAKKKLVIVGKVNQAEPDIGYFNTFIKPHINNRNIIYVGEIGFASKVKLYQDAYATLFPTLWNEPFGNVQIESMACGTPVITFDRAAAWEAVKDKTSGFIVKNGNVNSMAKSVERVGDLDRSKIRAWVEDNFSVQKITDQYEKAYQSLLK